MIQAEKKQLDKLLKENEKLQKEMQAVIHKEKHQQQIELLKEQNQISESKFIYLKEMDRKLKSILAEWKKTEDKNKVIKTMQALLFKQPEKHILQKKQKKIDNRYIETNEPVKVGDKVIMTANRQVAIVIGLRGKKAIVQVGAVPITVGITDLMVVRDKPEEAVGNG